MIDQNWEGSTEKFADLVAKLASEKGLIANDQIPTVRLVRDYVSRGILSKPRKEGKEVVFGYIQLIEFLACRALIKDGWPLKKIAEDQAESLEKILQSFEQGNPALLSDELANGFIPVFNRSNKIFEDKVIPYLKEKVEAEAAGTKNVIFCTHESDVRLKSLLSVCEPFELGTLPSKTLLDLRLQFPMEPF